METVKQREIKAFESMKKDFGYKNKMASPKMVKVVLNSGTGSGVKKDKNRNDFILGRLAKMTGQKGSIRGAKKSIASFKTREGDPVGVVVTLRGGRMYSFLDKLFNIVIPRTKDFRGLTRKSVDNIGNMTFSIKEHTIFPETADEELKDVFGMGVTLVTTAKSKEEAIKFFEAIGVPFKKED
ncbi:MAG: 50S ribosomal protein L5 [Candidatus Paceibacterota bacterium]|jgi:large subunit ribosomal protein L5